MASVAGIGAVLAYSWAATGLRPFTVPMEAAVAAPAAAMAVVGWFGRPERAAPPLRWREVGPWGGLVGVLVAAELVSYFSSPRADHPTVSSILDAIMAPHAGRALAFAAWLAGGWRLFGPGRPTGTP